MSTASNVLVFKRSTRSRGRDKRRKLAEAKVAEALGPITKGTEAFVLTGGQFSLVDLVVHCLNTTGPAHLTVSTWTAATADIAYAQALLTDGRIKSIRFLVDFSFPSRQPAYCAALASTFGPDCIRVTKNHAKFVLVLNAQWSVVVRTSMNLNENRRLETVEISEDKPLGRFLDDFVTEVFKAQGEDDIARRPGEHMEAFKRLSGQDSAGGTDVEKVMGDGLFATDVRRPGLSFDRGD